MIPRTAEEFLFHCDSKKPSCPPVDWTVILAAGGGISFFWCIAVIANTPLWLLTFSCLPGFCAGIIMLPSSRTWLQDYKRWLQVQRNRRQVEKWEIIEQDMHAQQLAGLRWLANALSCGLPCTPAYIDEMCALRDYYQQRGSRHIVEELDALIYTYS